MWCAFMSSCRLQIKSNNQISKSPRLEQRSLYLYFFLLIIHSSPNHDVPVVINPSLLPWELSTSNYRPMITVVHFPSTVTSLRIVYFFFLSQKSRFEGSSSQINSLSLSQIDMIRNFLVLALPLAISAAASSNADAGLMLMLSTSWNGRKCWTMPFVILLFPVSALLE